MKKLLLSALLSLTLAAPAFGYCYRFANTGSAVGVCVKGDSFDDRKRAKAICDKGEKKDCGSVSSHSSSCSGGRCYDENGKAHGSLSGY